MITDAGAASAIHLADAKATRREWIGLAVLALPCFVYAMDLTVLNLALPAISRQLNPSSAQMLWIVDIYGFCVAGLLITMGTLGDRIGRRKLLLVGAAAFGLASAIAAFSRSAEMLIAMRALLGIAGATLAPSTMALIRNMFHDGHERQLAIGVWIASFSVGGAMGPLVGGIVLQYFQWGAVFVPAVPVMALLLLLGPRLLPEYRDPNAGSIDLISAAMSLFAVLAGVYALKQLAEHGFAWTSVALLALGLVTGVMFVLRQGRLTYPLLDVHLFRQAKFSAAIAAYGLSCLAMFGVYVFIAQYLQLVLGLSPLIAGIATLPWGLAFIAGSLLSAKLARRWPPVAVLVYGLAAAALGFCMFVFVDGHWALETLIAGTTVMSLGLSPVFTIGNELIITSAPPERAGAASAVSETASELCGALGIAFIGSLGTFWYRNVLAAKLPEGISPDTATHALATLGGAMAASSQLPADIGAALLTAAQIAFVEAFHLAAAVGAGIVLFACATSAFLLKREATLGK